MLEAWKSKWGEPSEARLREKLEAEGYSVARYEYPPGTYFPDHTHPHEKKDAVVEGRFRIRMKGREFILGPGDLIHVPAGAVHSAEVVGEKPVVSLDAVKRR